MSACIIELNDIAVTATAAGGTRVSSPGYALLQGKQLVVGETARAQSRLQPQFTNSRFWQALSMDPLRQQQGKARHHADLAYAHLLQLHELAGKPEEVIFSVSSHFSREQLSVLLGVAAQCPFEARGLLDSALAATSGAALAGDALYIELQLHQSVITEIKHDGDYARQSVEVLQGTGLLALYDRWAHIISEAFIAQCRFDPLHSAASEQYLYDNMPSFLAGTSSRVEIEIDQGKSVHRARVERQALIDSANSLWQQVQERSRGLFPDHENLLLSHHWDILPEISTPADASPAKILPAETASLACHSNSKHIESTPGNALSFVTRLPAAPVEPTSRTKVELAVPGAEPNTAPQEQAPAVSPPLQQAATATQQTPQTTAPARQPSHILVDSTAYPLSKPWYICEQHGDIKLESFASADSQCLLVLDKGELRLNILNGHSLIIAGNTVSNTSELPAPVCGDSLQFSTDGPKILLIQVATDVSA